MVWPTTILTTYQFVDDKLNAGFIGAAYIAETNQTFDFVYFSPNKVKINLDAAEINGTATLVVNQNYYKGWKASNENIKSYNGLLAAEITSDDKDIEFSYSPKSFLIGAIISIAALLLSLLIFFKPKVIKRILFQEQS